MLSEKKNTDDTLTQTQMASTIYLVDFIIWNIQNLHLLFNFVEIEFFQNQFCANMSIKINGYQ